MNYRSRQLLDLAYELECTLRIPGCCTGGTGEPAHANQAIWGKGGAMKAHDFAFASACRACHMELDQGKNYSEESRQFFWLRGHVETMRQLWGRGLLKVNAQPRMVICIGNGPAHSLVDERAAKRERKSRCTTKRALPRRYGP